MYWQSERQKQLYDLKKNLNPSYRADTERRDGAWGYESYPCFRDLVQFSIKHLNRELERNVTPLNSMTPPFLVFQCS